MPGPLLSFDICLTCAIICAVDEQTEGTMPHRRARFSVLWVLFAVTVLLGAVLRFYRLGTLPPGLYHDEAFNGMDAWRVLEGERPIFFEANNGREPLFLYGMAAALALLGRTPYAVRVTAAVLGTLTVPATFLMARALFGARVGLWSALLIAVAPWPINLSRIGLRAVSMPLVTALGLWFWWAGRRQVRWRRIVGWVLGGTLLGLSLYTYTAARLVLVAVAGFVLFQVWVSRERMGRWEVLCLALAALVAMMPLTAYWITHPGSSLGRSSQVSILNPEINHGDLFGLLTRNVIRAAGLFTFRGDSIPRHNVPLRPLFDPLTSAFFLLGGLLSVGRARRDGASALALIWTGVMLLPTILAEDCPHFLRAVGVLPMAAVYPALGLEWASQRLAQRGPAWASKTMIGVVLAVASLWGSYDYLSRHGGTPDLAYPFEAELVQEAVEINRFLGTGWQGQGIQEPEGTPIPSRHVYLAPRAWEDRLTVNFLVASPERISILGRDPVEQVDEVLVLAWPHEELSAVREVLPHPARIEAWPGPLERGDLDAEPRLLYVAYRATRLDDAPVVAARFEDEIELLGWDMEPAEGERTRLRLRWRAVQPLSTAYTVFVHLVRDGQMIAQDDGAPGGGYYPTTWWTPGDEIVDTHTLDAVYDPDREQVIVGWYELTLMRHLRVLGDGGKPGADRFELK